MIDFDSSLSCHVGSRKRKTGEVEKPQEISGDKIAFAAQQIYSKIKYGCSAV